MTRSKKTLTINRSLKSEEVLVDLKNFSQLKLKNRRTSFCCKVFSWTSLSLPVRRTVERDEVKVKCDTLRFSHRISETFSVLILNVYVHVYSSCLFINKLNVEWNKGWLREHWSVWKQKIIKYQNNNNSSGNIILYIHLLSYFVFVEWLRDSVRTP